MLSFGASAILHTAFAGGFALLAAPEADERPDSIATPEETALDSRISPEVGMDEPVFGQPANFQIDPALALGDQKYLVVWHDDRESNEEPRIYGARVALDGTVFDTHNIRMGAGTRPSVASDGQGFLVVYRRGEGVFATRVGADGKPLGAELMIDDATAYGEQYEPDVAFDGSNYIVVWDVADDGENSAHDIHRARVSPEGELLDPGGVLTVAGIDTNDWTGHQPAIASNGEGSLLVWHDQRIRGLRLAPGGGAPVDEPFFVSPPLAGADHSDLDPELAFVDDAYVVAWTHADEGEYGDQVVATRVDPQGTVLDPSGIPITAADEQDEYFTHIVVGSDGQDAVLLFTRGIHEGSHGSYRVRIDPQDGEVLDEEPVVLADRSFGHSITVAPAPSLAVYADDSTDDEAGHDTFIAATRLAPGGDALDEPGVLLSRSANAQFMPSVSFDGEHVLVVWADHRNYDPENFIDIYGARFDDDGALLDPGGIPIRKAKGWNVAPRALFDGKNHVVVSARAGAIPFDGDIWPARELVRVSPGGALLGAQPLQLPFDQVDEQPLAAIWNGSKTLLAGINHGAWAQDVDLVRVTQAGALYGQPKRFTPPFMWNWVSLSHGGVGTLLAGGSEYGEHGLVASRLDSTGKLLDPQWLKVSSPTVAVGRAAIATSGSLHLVVWAEPHPEDSGDSVVRAARVNHHGKVLDPGGKLLAPRVRNLYASRPCWSRAVTDDFGACPAVAFDGYSFVVVWRSPPDALGVEPPDLYAARVSTSGAVLENFKLASGSTAEGPPAVVAANGLTAVVYERFMIDAPYQATRVRARLLHAP